VQLCFTFQVRHNALPSDTESGSESNSEEVDLTSRILKASPDDILSGPACRPLPLPDLRSPDSIEKDVADKESKLAEVRILQICFFFGVFTG
jgi:hypothetical protein